MFGELIEILLLNCNFQTLNFQMNGDINFLRGKCYDIFEIDNYGNLTKLKSTISQLKIPTI